MKQYIFLLFLYFFSIPLFACSGTSDQVEGGLPLRLVIYSEPFWNKNEIPKGKVGKVTVSFRLSSAGSPHDVRMIEMVPSDLNKQKLIESIEMARFEPEINLKTGPKDKTYTYTFILSFENALF